MKIFIIGISFLSILLIILTPQLSAIQHQIVHDEVNKQYKQLLLSIKDTIGFIFIILSFILLVISDIVAIKGWNLLTAWESSMGLGIAVIVASGIGSIITLLFLLIACISNPVFITLIIPYIIGLSPVWLPALIWVINSRPNIQKISQVSFLFPPNMNIYTLTYF